MLDSSSPLAPSTAAHSAASPKAQANASENRAVSMHVSHAKKRTTPSGAPSGGLGGREAMRRSISGTGESRSTHDGRAIQASVPHGHPSVFTADWMRAMSTSNLITMSWLSGFAAFDMLRRATVCVLRRA